jgi:polysaccharide pyruvyl transferase WcaK-like protein
MKISFFGHFGTMNSGNESTLLAILSRLRNLSPDFDFCCICSNPRSVVAWYGIDAVPITTRRVHIWDRQARLDKRLRGAFIGLSEELREYVQAFRTLKGTDAFIVPGTGLLTDAFGLSGWGPHNLFKWTLMENLRRCKILFVSVGAGPIDRSAGRFLVKSALALADYRSYRDDSSINFLRGIGFRKSDDRRYPDLAFSLPSGLLSVEEVDRRRRAVVGLGLMVYAEDYSIANPARDTYTAYLDSLVVFATWLLSQDYDIRLLLGDGDTAVIQEFKSLLRARLQKFDEERVIDEPITSVQEVLSQLAGADIVVATRFHNVILASLLKKPVIAISFHHKCASLMSEMGLSGYCHDIGQMNAEVDERRRALDEQYDLLFKSLVAAA